MDIDHFKFGNDIYGHQKGDEVLKVVADTLQQAVRKADLVVRWGGDDFMILLPETDLERAVSVVEKVQIVIGDLQIEEIDVVTLSLGVAVFESSIGVTVANADKALYRAKDNGRNRVETV